MTYIFPSSVAAVLRSGRIATIEFTSRKDGRRRTINGRTGVRKGVNGTGSYIAAAHGLIRVFTMGGDRRGHGKWRSVDYSRISRIVTNGQEYVVR